MMVIVDAHVYVGPSLFGQDQSLSDLQRRMEVCGVEKAVLFPNRPPTYHLSPANDLVAQAISSDPERFFGFCRVDPWQGSAAMDELKRGREELNLHGLLLHPWEEQFQVASPLLSSLLEYAAEHALPVFIETGYPLFAHPLDVAEVAKRYPETTFIGSHGLQLDSSAFALVDAELAMFECENLVMETSGMYAPAVMEKVVQELGAQRLIFGSHSPWHNMQFEVERVKRLNLDTEQTAAVLGGNMLRVFDRR